MSDVFVVVDANRESVQGNDWRRWDVVARERNQTDFVLHVVFSNKRIVCDDAGLVFVTFSDVLHVRTCARQLVAVRFSFYVM